MCKLVVAAHSELDGNTDSFDRHDGDRTNSRTYGKEYKWVLSSIHRRHFVYHDHGKYGNQSTEQEKPFIIG